MFGGGNSTSTDGLSLGQFDPLALVGLSPRFDLGVGLLSALVGAARVPELGPVPAVTGLVTVKVTYRAAQDHHLPVASGENGNVFFP